MNDFNHFDGKNDKDKRIHDLELLVANQQKALDVYRRRFNKVKRSFRNPFFAASFFFSYARRKLWRIFPEKFSPKKYTSWIREVEAETYDSIHESELKSFTPQSLGITLINTGEGQSAERIAEDIGAVKTEFFALMDPADTLTDFAMYAIARTLKENPTVDMIYSDEDTLLENGLRTNPIFKPGFSPDTIFSYHYTGNLTVYRRSLFDKTNLSGSYASREIFLYDLALHAFLEGRLICHIPEILYHNNASKPDYFSSTAMAKRTDCKAAIINHKKDFLKAHDIPAKVEWMEDVCDTRVIFTPEESPLVSIIIPSKDHFEILKTCLTTLLGKTEYKNYEIILVDNGSAPDCEKACRDFCAGKGAHYHYEPMDFNFATMCNIGAGLAKGDYLLFLNDDIEIINPVWLFRMLGAAMRPHVGAVGAKLIYPGSSLIQHDGIVDMINGPVHALHYGDDKKILARGRNRYDFNCLGVTGAALLISKEKFNEVGGFNEVFAVGHNDVDLCYSLIDAGYYNVVRNDAVLIHHESISRGHDDVNKKKHERQLKEQRLLYLRHPSLMSNDPFYNPNLTQTNTDFSLNQSEF